MNRREHLISLGALILLASQSARTRAAASELFSWEDLIKRAQGLSKSDYRPLKASTAAAGIDYDIGTQISYRADRQLFNQPNIHSSVRLFPLSRSAQKPINVFVVADGRATPVQYDPTAFETRSAVAAELMKQC